MSARRCRVALRCQPLSRSLGAFAVFGPGFTLTPRSRSAAGKAWRAAPAWPSIPSWHWRPVLHIDVEHALERPGEAWQL